MAKTFYLKVLSPVHIGCDEVYEPTGFFINEKDRVLISFDPLDFFRGLSEKDKAEYSRICGQGTIESLLELYKFMRAKKQDVFNSHTVDICRGFLKHYEQTLNLPRNKIQRELHKFSIFRTSFSPLTQLPYIPGSAIKGALRTAYLNYLAKNKNVNYDRKGKNPGRALECSLLEYDHRHIEADPFRLLKVSDFQAIGNIASKILYAINEKKKKTDRPARGPHQILESIQPGSVFIGTIEVLPRPEKSNIKISLTEKTPLESAGVFYEKEKAREEKELAVVDLPQNKFSVSGDSCLLRIGRHSGAESVTIEGHRDIKIMGQKGRKTFSPKGATTFWLAADDRANYNKGELLPFGWVEIGELTESIVNEAKKIAINEIDTKAEKAGVNETSLKKASPPPVEEVWENAFVNYSPGGGGILTAQSADERKAQIHGKDKAINATDQSLHKKIFESKKRESKAHVTVRKIGNAWIIVKVEPAA